MLELIAHNLAPIMFISVMGMLLIGYPVAFSLSAATSLAEPPPMTEDPELVSMLLSSPPPMVAYKL